MTPSKPPLSQMPRAPAVRAVLGCYSGISTVPDKRPAFWIYIALLADVVLFFHKPLFSSQYLFPWDFRGVQLPPITFLADQLRHGHIALWNPYVYDGFPVF